MEHMNMATLSCGFVLCPLPFWLFVTFIPALVYGKRTWVMSNEKQKGPIWGKEKLKQASGMFLLLLNSNRPS